MSKRLERMRAQPGGGWSMADVEAVCREFGIDCLASRSGGSHHKVTHPSQREILTIPFKRPVKPVYIRKLVEFIDAVRSVS